MMKGYKVINPDWICRGTKYSCPGTFTMEEKPILCERGFHFCSTLNECFDYYWPVDETYHFVEVIAHGDIVHGDDKCCTNKLEIVREIPYNEVLKLTNTGIGNTGLSNSGDENKGCCNAGNWNDGHFNTGNLNSGDYNSGANNSGNWNSGSSNAGGNNAGDRNSGNWNSGYYNSGDHNSGDHNSGRYNTGDWNTASYTTGCFNTISEQHITLFNKPTDWSLLRWKMCNARSILIRVQYLYFTGHIKTIQEAWDKGATKEEKQIVMSLPNFDPVIFKECTGIDVCKEIVNEED